MVNLEKDSDDGLAGAIDRILDKGLVINADITVSVAGVELLGIKVRAALASFETSCKVRPRVPVRDQLQNCCVERDDDCKGGMSAVWQKSAGRRADERVWPVVWVD